MIRKAWFAVPALLVLSAVGAAALSPNESPAPVSSPAPLAASNCTYYNNAQHSVVVGRFGYDCCNNPVAWGHKTAFKVCGGCFPCWPPPP
jgi:hypothetical protein